MVGGERRAVVIVKHDPVLAVGEVGDAVQAVQGGRPVVDPEHVIAGSAGQQVGALAATQQIVAGVAGQGIVSGAATQPVCAVRAREGLGDRRGRWVIAMAAVIVSVIAVIIAGRIVPPAAAGRRR